jgi:hypothetical protein
LREPQPGVAPQTEIGTLPSGTERNQTSGKQTVPAGGQAVRAMGLAQPAREQGWQDRTPPLLVKRAPRPTPHPPGFSPLWDDVSAEFEKMRDSLPKAQPFNGNEESSEIAELPTSGAVQCYIGSVMVNGMKVFLQAVPARPYARPAGFDHSLVSRDGECYWVKYFIQSN